MIKINALTSETRDHDGIHVHVHVFIFDDYN